MSQSKVKKIRKQIFALGLETEVANRAYKEAKKLKPRKEMLMRPAKLSKKRHTGESYEDFKTRRRICNRKRRQRELCNAQTAV